MSFKSKFKYKDRWGLGPFFKKEGHKTQLKKEVVFTALGALSCLLVLFNFGGGSVEVKKTIDTRDTHDQASVFVDFDKIEIKVINDLKKSKKKLKSKPYQKKPLFFTKAKVYERNFLENLTDGTEGLARLKLDLLPQTVAQAILIKPLIIDGEEILPKGTKFYGVSKELSGRMSIEFTKARLPTGEKYKIKAFAHERKKGAFGLKGSQVGPRTVSALASTGLHFIGGLSEGMIERQMTEAQVSIKGNLRNGLLHGASKASMEQSRQVLSDLKNRQSVLRVKKGKKFKIIFYDME